MLDSQEIERQVEDLLVNIFKPEKASNKRSFQKKKFEMLSKFIADLFNCNNSRECFNNISSLIILILNIYNEKFPVDIYSLNTDDFLKKSNSKYKLILKEEFLKD